MGFGTTIYDWCTTYKKVIMQCIISTLNKTDTYDSVTSVTVPTDKGQSVIKTGHAEYFTNTVSGNLFCLDSSNKRVKINIGEGVCWVANDVVMIIA